jgi:acyl carrier protein
VVCQYDADLFEPKTIEAFVGSFGSVVESGVLDPTRRLEELLDGYQGVPDRGGEDASIPSAQAPREAPEATAEAAADAPLSPTEQLLAKLWRELLKLDDVAVTDNFFTLGGDSLLATRLTVRIQNQLRVSVTPRAVFETGSLRGLARFVDASAKSAAEPIPPRIARRR